MALRGDLASVDLAQVFQMLALNKKVGLLTIQSPNLSKVLYFEPQGVTLYYNPHVLLDRALITFVRVGRIDARAAEEVREHASRNRQEVLDTLLAGGYLTQEELDAQLRYEVEEEIYELFFCRDARFEFLEGVDSIPEREGAINEAFFFNTESVIMEAARRIDEWSYVSERIPSGLEVFCRTKGRPESDSVDDDQQIVYDCVDGKRTVDRIIEVSGLARFTVFKSLSQLLDVGLVDALAADKLIKTGQSCLKEGRAEDAISLFEKAVELDVGGPEAHALAAQAYRATDEFESASYHLKCEAEYRVASGDPRGAANQLLAACRLLPTDLAARERLVDLVLANDLRLSDYDGLAEGKELVGLLMAAGDTQRVRSILERMLTASPEDLDLKKLLASVHSKAGDQERVIELYDSIAATLVRQGKPIDAIAYLQKILMLDRSRSDISDRVRALYALEERSRSRRRVMGSLAGIMLLLVGLGIGYTYYDQAAREAFERIDVQQYVLQQEYAQAAAIYDEFLASYPLTTMTGRARQELAKIEGLRLKRVATLRNDAVAAERQLERIRGEYREEWRRHEKLFLAGQPEAALAAIGRARELLAQAGQQDDLAWSLEQQVDRTYQKIEQFVAAAEDLERRHREELQAGRTENAWALAVELQSGYDITGAARRSRIPVSITSRPPGARLLQGGQPVQVVVDGVTREAITPVLLPCKKATYEFELQLDGFEPASLRLDPMAQAAVTVPLRIIPAHSIGFREKVSGPVGGHGDWLVAGLRNGHLGIGSARAGREVRSVTLGGLKEVVGAPAVSGDLAWFFSNELTLECVQLRTALPATGWPVNLEFPAVTPLLAQDGRLVFVDEQQHLHCFEQVSGKRLWSRPLKGTQTGPPTLWRRMVLVAEVGGVLRMYDATDGDLQRTLRSPSPLSTGVHAQGNLMVFGCADGFVRAIDVDGRIVWSTDAGRALADRELVVGNEGVFVLGTTGIARLDLANGRPTATVALARQVRDMQLRNGELLVTSRIERTSDRAQHDLLQSFEAGELVLRWEYEDQSELLGTPSVDGRFVAVVGGAGTVVLLR